MNYVSKALEGLYGGHLKEIHKINELYRIYEGKQEWTTAQGLDYTPTKKITNLIKKLISTRARFMFGRPLFFDIRQIQPDTGEETTFKDQAQAKEDLLADIIKETGFNSKLIKAYKDCAIAGRIAIKLWAHKDEGIKIIFTPAQEFFVEYDVDDVDKINKVTFMYITRDAEKTKDQRITKQVWEMIGGTCILNEAVYDGEGRVVEVKEEDYNTGLDFIPVVVIRNGGLTGETEGESYVKEIWDNQDAYNKLTSDDIDALKFQMFGQDVITDADEESVKNIKIAPGAIIDLQTDRGADGRQANIGRLESKFSYKDKFEDTINRIKNDMYDIMEVPNIGLEQLKGLMQSGKSMKALYWGLIASCDEEWIDWETGLNEMVEKIFKLIEKYNLYNSREIARYETTLKIEHYYPLQEDEHEKKRIDMEEILAEVRSRASYMDKWGEYEDVDAELERIRREKLLMQDSYTQSLIDDLT